MSNRSDLMSDLDLVGQLRPAFHQVQDAPAPDQIDHARFRAYTKTSHDVGGEPDAPAVFELKEEEQWELNTYVRHRPRASRCFPRIREQPCPASGAPTSARPSSPPPSFNSHHVPVTFQIQGVTHDSSL
jgi:hypothetical protein